MSNPEHQVDFGTDDWTVDVLRSVISPASTEDAAVTVAVTWLTLGKASAAAAVIFVSSSQCVVARAGHDNDGTVEVFVDTARVSIASLLSESGLPRLTSAIRPTHNGQWRAWPQHRAACFVDSQEEADDDLAEDVTAQILARAISPQSLMPSSQRLESLAEFAAGAGHEINNPLGSIIGQTQLLLKSEHLTDRRQALSTIAAQAWRIRDMIGDCMLFARPPEPDFQACPLNQLVRQAAENAAQALKEPASRLQFRFSSENISGTVDATQFRTLVSHLVRNALEACRSAGVDQPVAVELQQDDQAVILSVTDQGPEIVDETIRRHLFDPCFSGRQAGRGMGFGLPVCWQIARTHNGLLLQETPEQGGNLFFVAIPCGSH